MPFVSYPALTLLSCQKLRMSSADPTSSTSAEAVCTTTSASRVRLLPADDAASDLLDAAQPRPGEVDGGQHAERARRQHRNARREEQRREVQARVGESRNRCAAKPAGNGIRRRADQGRDAGPRDERAGHPSCCCEKQRLGHL